MRLAIMQGRLLPPYDGHFQSFPLSRWREEFPLAQRARLDAIEWIYDSVSEDGNPLNTDAGLAEMAQLSEKHGIAVVSVCADYFMEHPFLRVSPAELEVRIGKLLWLLERCQRAGIQRMVLPFVDNSRIENETDQDEVVRILSGVLIAAEKAGIELHLETSLGPEQFSLLLARLQHPLLKVNYDSGNSASLGYDVTEEIAAYGERIGSVHIKDRVRGGGTVPLGSGNANIPVLLSHLSRIAYKGDFVMQIARDEPGMELGWIAKNRELVMNQLQEAGFGRGENR
jgi:L-ribulose-5-phosphate 3-epimerase